MKDPVGGRYGENVINNNNGERLIEICEHHNTKKDSSQKMANNKTRIVQSQ